MSINSWGTNIPGVTVIRDFPPSQTSANEENEIPLNNSGKVTTKQVIATVCLVGSAVVAVMTFGPNLLK